MAKNKTLQSEILQIGGRPTAKVSCRNNYHTYTRGCGQQGFLGSFVQGPAISIFLRGLFGHRKNLNT